ncbi:ScbR family autoregulator-binding transcription factor [Streptomyces aurantiacus]|uniref:TetR family transcriptional regulator n=2 Tax=Streptomyces aurantiacus TaxID=47760 RepID=A0A7G1P3V1_9ACTN|nr:ScbR family autoregulator-binding transcription factor [Streptomyces aurantiacus]BCL28476.1 TetR family transcriptional regulator [Streptomyces aurantiacus]
MAQQERAVRTRNALIESAAELFSKYGFDVVSLSTISARAGVSNGALHFHFASKAALSAAVWEAAAQRLRQITHAGAARGQAAGSGGALQVLVDTTHALLRGLRHDVILRAGFDLSESPVPVAPGADLRRRWQAWVESLLAQAAKEGALARDVPPQDAAHAVVAATVGFGALGSRNAQWLSQSMLTRFWALLLPRLAAETMLKELIASGRRQEGVAGAAGAAGAPVGTGADGTPPPRRLMARQSA